jgi:biotin-dependent carboxylase-like uncharacterized protein
MSGVLRVLEAGPAITLQDMGRSGYIAQGLTRGGALDRLALIEGAALLDRPVTAAIEMIGFGGSFQVSAETRIALTGGQMQASLDGVPLAWNASHALPAGAKLTIGGVQTGVVGYLHVGSGFDAPKLLGSMSAHLAAGLGTILAPGTELALSPDTGNRVGWKLTPEPRFSGGVVRILRSHQSHIFGEDTLERFTQTRFTRDARANRQGIRMTPEGPGFAAQGGLTVVSEIIAPGDIQVTGDGAPYVLMCENQTTGGYPRLATVLPSDLPRVAQVPLGTEMRFALLDHSDAANQEAMAQARWKKLAQSCAPMVRDPADINDLLSYQLISGVSDGQDGDT